MWELGQQKEKREKIWEPEVVSRDGGIFGAGNMTLIHETSSDAFSVDALIMDTNVLINDAMISRNVKTYF